MEFNRQGFDKNGLLTLFEDQSDKTEVKFGTVAIPPGGRVPEEGLSLHEENEYSFIIKGQLEGESGGKKYKVNESEATFIPAGEEHWAVNSSEKPCEIVWALVKEK
ncbi:cupin domain-containing protein [Aquibacillus sp. 3ASR75-11]|uniref:Cupin domain-containing protein n=1 Tax=Terrihalobacillus insolitus TaxID=2950438 RepID=A0A9X4APW1_9BACI|nr:cupin domain-containing protein [Terrihalobacillus insolitus]MDC3413782.1 cupin domain-containing protein [Terrihalobacillus insolitus]MDC3425950.1 cupin domain-containing protein [Terrihalobacillus insolitus]